MQTIARGIAFVDLMFLGKPRIIATAVLQSAGGVALVDPGPSTCVGTLKAELAAHGIAVTDVRSFFPTHVHLDLARAPASLCMDNHLPIVVFDVFAPGTLVRLLQSERLGTLVDDVPEQLLPKE